ncbi:hypothetical protein LLEC1_02450 [Akanthomyces lecanii]|uniref:Cupin type-2 domain-containing protein n=1 Tax=Cordyceps confragosa TaxID=2714763 RepID=A0A179IKT3_CORDF|nr:hypothetical protein LLEC1_02450 [Akanthomyces lecanii]
MSLVSGMDEMDAKVSDGQPFKDEPALLQRLKEVDVSPLWAQMARLNPALPNPTTEPFLWQYQQIRPCLLGAGELISEKQAERRVLMLVNPKRTAPYTTDTLYAGLQLVQPRETAPAHRHAAFAVRYIIEGEGGYTAVQGNRVAMHPGDVITTPTWNWHDHGKKGADEGGDEDPVIWLDGLDLPNFIHFPVHFNEHYSAARYPATDVDDSPIVFPWKDMLAKLDSAPGSWAAVPYLHADGSEVSRVIGASAERLDKGAESPVRQETSSSVYHVIEGSGWSKIGDRTLHWQRGDTFCIPAWYKYKHFANREKEGVYLYRFDDRPMLKSLGLLRTHVEGADTFADLA